MKQPSQWTCGLVVNASFTTFGSHEFDFLVYCFLFTPHNLFRQLFTPTKYISAYILNIVTLTLHKHVTFLVLFGRCAILRSRSSNLVDLSINPLLWQCYSTLSHNAYGQETKNFMDYEKYSVPYLSHNVTNVTITGCCNVAQYVARGTGHPWQQTFEALPPS